MNRKELIFIVAIFGSALDLGYISFYYLMHYLIMLNGYAYVLAPPYVMVELLLFYPLMILTPWLWAYLAFSKTPSPSLPVEPAFVYIPPVSVTPDTR